MAGEGELVVKGWVDMDELLAFSAIGDISSTAI